MNMNSRIPQSRNGVLTFCEDTDRYVLNGLVKNHHCSCVIAVSSTCKKLRQLTNYVCKENDMPLVSRLCEWAIINDDIRPPYGIKKHRHFKELFLINNSAKSCEHYTLRFRNPSTIKFLLLDDVNPMMNPYYDGMSFKQYFEQSLPDIEVLNKLVNRKFNELSIEDVTHCRRIIRGIQARSIKNYNLYLNLLKELAEFYAYDKSYSESIRKIAHNALLMECSSSRFPQLSFPEVPFEAWGGQLASNNALKSCGNQINDEQRESIKRIKICESILAYKVSKQVQSRSNTQNFLEQLDKIISLLGTAKYATSFIILILMVPIIMRLIIG